MLHQIAVLLSLAEGTGIITESVWANSFRFVEKLKRMGEQISVDGKLAVIEGVNHLDAAPVKATDLRAGAALVIAGLCAEGVTQIENIQQLERGYETIEEKLQTLSADIRRIHIPEPEAAQAI